MDDTSDPSPFLPFEDDDLTLMPMAARRALDRAGLKLSLRAWQAMSHLVRHGLVGLGAQAEVDAVRVRALVAGAEPSAEPIDASDWAGLRPLERFALYSYARRGRGDKLERAYDSMLRARSSG